MAGIASNFYEVLDVRILDAAAPVGFNSCYFTWGAYRSGTEYFYEEDNYPGTPDMTFSAVRTPTTGEHAVAYSSGVPHYTQSTDNAFTYVISVLNATGHSIIVLIIDFFGQRMLLLDLQDQINIRHLMNLLVQVQQQELIHHNKILVLELR